MPYEPEAVSKHKQDAMSKRARDAERACARARDAWRDASAQITDAVTTFRARSGHVPPAVANGTRAVLRAAELVGRRLQA